LITEAARAEGGWLLNKDGYRYLQDYDLGKPTPEPKLRSMELGPRDRVSQAFVHEHEKGRTVDTEYGPVVYLDIRHLGADVIDEKLPFIRELCLNYQHIDPVTELIPVQPVVHYMMGGVHTDILGATTLPGLYAAGETACVSINGANRLGSNSLPECLVFGARAGRAAAEYAAEHGKVAASPSRAVQAQARTEAERLERELSRRAEGTDRIADIRADMRATLETAAGIYRDGPTLTAAVDQIKLLQERFARAGIDDHSRTFNTELTALLELSGMLDIAQTIIESALRREESRGAHQRTDFPNRDDEHFLAHTLVHREPDGTARVEYLPVTVTRWAPGERVYGR
jgi:fumarate reductase flavoprotein subunit